MKFHAQLLKQGFSNGKEPLGREEILLPEQGIHSPSPHQYCSLDWGAGSTRGKAVTGKAQAQTFAWTAQDMGGTHLSSFPKGQLSFLSNSCSLVPPC